MDGHRPHRADADLHDPGDADALHGDARSVRIQFEKTVRAEMCKLRNFKLNGSEIVYTATCRVGAVNVSTTTYHGDHFEPAKRN